MKMKLFIMIIFSWTSLDATPQEKLINYLKEVNDALIMMLNHPIGSRKQMVHLERAKTLIQEAILAEGVAENHTLYAIAGILLGDPVLAQRAVEIQKSLSHKNSIQLERRAVKLEDEAERYRQAIEDRIEEEEMFLMVGDHTLTEDLQRHQNILSNLKKTKSWAEAQCLTHGFLKEAIYMYQQNKLEKGE